MRAPRINANGDIVIVNGDIQLVEGSEEIAQSVKAILMTRLNEFELSNDFGTDYSVFEENKRVQEREVEDMIRFAIAQENRIATIENIVVAIDYRTRSITAQVEMTATNGEVINVSEVI